MKTNFHWRHGSPVSARSADLLRPCEAGAGRSDGLRLPAGSDGGGSGDRRKSPRRRLGGGGRDTVRRKATAEIRFGRADDGAPGKIDRIRVTCRSVSLEKALEELTGRYGEPSESGIVPYVPANHGAVYWHLFETDSFAVRLSKASEDRHIEIRFAPSADDLRL